ncbi:hypothetical protein A1353_00790 [Methylomonas methanica]|uniref:DUF1640 domain-containing protein n=1 Tax=Methylomonas methanica TaxID=421 RepID=A0A177M7R9_METMH|nr:coiled-coil domain-containing protein [Methylomonas methanica]OAI01788.1 hypothetical protein A1353_00790 [Methylomonas methanica]
MTAIMFDTHEFIKELKGAGFSEEQAEIITKLQKTAIAATLEQAKHDYDLDDLSTRSELIRWIGSVGLLQTALISALLLKLSAFGRG